MQELAMLATRTRSSLMVVHHTPKGKRDAKGDIGAGRGAFAVAGKARGIFTICNVTGDDDEFGLGGHSRRPLDPTGSRKGQP